MIITPIQNLDEVSVRRDKIYSLAIGQLYFVIEISDEAYRVVAEKNEPYLYDKTLFTVVDPSIPSHWSKDEYEDGEYFIGPSELSRVGFYEDFFDGVPAVVETFWRVYNRETTCQINLELGMKSKKQKWLPVFVVYRFSYSVGEIDNPAGTGNLDMRVKQVFNDEQSAANEVLRLRQHSKSRGSIYFYQRAKIKPDVIQSLSARLLEMKKNEGVS